MDVWMEGVVFIPPCARRQYDCLSSVWLIRTTQVTRSECHWPVATLQINKQQTTNRRRQQTTHEREKRGNRVHKAAKHIAASARQVRPGDREWHRYQRPLPPLEDANRHTQITAHRTHSKTRHNEDTNRSVRIGVCMCACSSSYPACQPPTPN